MVTTEQRRDVVTYVKQTAATTDAAISQRRIERIYREEDWLYVGGRRRE